MELISYVLHPQDGSPADPKVKSLNLSKNVKIGKFGVRTFAPAL